MSMVDAWLVRIEFARVQGFLFAARRLRDMVGANVLLGETLRNQLARLARDEGAYGERIVGDRLDTLPVAGTLDPLSSADAIYWDDPRTLLQSQGVLARDGGHFRAFFALESAANAFRDKAEELLGRELPGLRFEAEVEKLGQEPRNTGRAARFAALLDLPQFQVCQASGVGPAAKLDGIATDTEFISEAVQHRRNAYDRFRKKESLDIIGLLRKSLKLPLAALESPVDFEEMCGSDYMAVVHADGNGVSDRVPQRDLSRTETAEERLERELTTERFFHSLRVAVRRAVVTALGATFDGFEGRTCPYQLLMLGGDDLLLVCRAPFALPFLVHYARALADADAKLTDGQPLSVGAGVAIARAKVPFHRLHQLAENLAASAKRLYRQLPAGARGSVADWAVTTSSWAEDPIDVRRSRGVVRYEVEGLEEKLVLTRRPYPILRSTESPSLEGLLESTNHLKEGSAYSQLRYLADQLGRGRRAAEQVFRGLPATTLAGLRSAGYSEPWSTAQSGIFTTGLSDLVEVFGITRLGRRELDDSEEVSE